MINIHASLIADLMLYNFDWLYNVLNTGVLEERDIYIDDVVRYTFQVKDISRVYIWTRDTKNILKKIRAVRDLGYKTEIINMINFYDSFYEPSKDKNNLILQRYLRNANRVKISLSYGPIFVNNYTDLNWHKGQVKYLWRRVRGYSDTLYLDFNLNERYLSSKRLEGQALNDKEKEEFINYVQSVVGPRVKIKEKPSYYEIDSKKDFDFGIKNFCFSRSFLNEGMDNIHEQRANELIHYSDSNSLILKEAPGEQFIRRKLLDGKFQEEAIKEKIEKKNNKMIVNNTNSLLANII